MGCSSSAHRDASTPITGIADIDRPVSDRRRRRCPRSQPPTVANPLVGPRSGDHEIAPPPPSRMAAAAGSGASSRPLAASFAADPVVVVAADGDLPFRRRTRPTAAAAAAGAARSLVTFAREEPDLSSLAYDSQDGSSLRGSPLHLRGGGADESVASSATNGTARQDQRGRPRHRHRLLHARHGGSGVLVVASAPRSPAVAGVQQQQQQQQQPSSSAMDSAEDHLTLWLSQVSAAASGVGGTPSTDTGHWCESAASATDANGVPGDVFSE